MAYLKKIYKKNGSIFYYSEIKSPQFAASKYISLSTSSKTTALIRHHMVEKKESDIKDGLEFIFPWESDNGGKVKLKQLKLSECIELWLKIKKVNVSTETWRRYRVSLKAFLNTISHSMPISSIKTRHIEDFKRHYKSIHTDVGININLRGIKACIRWAFDEGYIDTLPKITMIKEVKQKPKYINEAKWNKIMELTCVDPFYKDVFDIYRTIGARRSEIILGHLEGNFLIVEAQDSKTRRELEITLSPLQAATVREIHKRKDQHIRSGKNLVTFTNTFTRAFSKACKAAGFYERGKTNLHCLRHTYALMRYLETKDLYRVSKELNHTSITTTEIYAQFSFARLSQDFPRLCNTLSKVATTKVATPSINSELPPLLNSSNIADC